MAWPSLAARIISILLIIAYPLTAFFTLPPSGAASLLGLCIYCIILSPILALIELPFCCSCSIYCQCIARYLKYVAGWWWARGLIYVGLCAGGFAIYKVTTGSGWTWLLLILVFHTIAAALYFVATFMGEPHPAAELFGLSAKDKAAAAAASSAGAGAPSTGAGKGSSSGGGGLWAMFGAKSPEEAVGRAVIAGASAAAANPKAATSTAQALFGGGSSSGADVESGAGGSSGSAGPSFAPPKKEASASASMFTGGSLFGGGGGSSSKSSKYGYADHDVPEANPFVS